MLSKALKIPWGGVEFNKLTKEEFDKFEYFSYGFYHVKVLNSDYRLFRQNSNHWYTHTDLNYAKNKLHYQLELIEDGDENAMLYTKLRSIRTIFKPFVGFLFEYKDKGIKQVKKYLNALWGALCKKNILDVEVGNLHSDKMLYSIRPNFKGLKKDLNMSNHIETVTCKNSYFDLDYARIGPFVIASGRLKISEIINTNLDDCVRVHTDSYIGKTPLTNIKLGNYIGDLKYEEEGYCEIHDSCNYVFNGIVHGKAKLFQDDDDIIL